MRPRVTSAVGKAFRAPSAFLRRELRRSCSILCCVFLATACDTQIDSNQTAIKYTEHLSCVVQDDQRRWQHMYRLDMSRPHADFVGGFGQRIHALQSSDLVVDAQQVRASFSASAQADVADFEIQISRRDLTYRLLQASDDSRPTPHLGNCTLLQGDVFALLGSTTASAAAYKPFAAIVSASQRRVKTATKAL